MKQTFSWTGKFELVNGTWYPITLSCDKYSTIKDVHLAFRHYRPSYAGEDFRLRGRWRKEFI